MVALVALLVAAGLVVLVTSSASARPGGSGWPVLAAAFDRSEADPNENLADFGELYTYAQAGTSWEQVAGESGLSEGAFLLTTTGGDPSAEFGLLARFDSFPRDGTLRLSFNVTPGQNHAVLDNVVTGERGVDILGLRFDRDERMRVTGSPQLVRYQAGCPYHVDIFLSLGIGQLMDYRVQVSKVETGESVGLWIGSVTSAMPSGARWRKPHGSDGSFVLDDIVAWWAESSE